MTKAALFFICLLLILSCKQQPVNGHLSLRDSALNSYLTAVDSVAGYDTLNNDFQMLRAYRRNDTAYLSGYLQKRSEAMACSEQEEYKRYAIYPDSCVHRERLDESAYEEAYRFTYSEAFCPFKEMITVVRTGDSTGLYFVLYKPVHDSGWDSSGCKIIRQFTKVLSKEEWNRVDEAMRYADFWALKRDNDIQGLDGSSLEVEGYSNLRLKVLRPPRYHVVNRWMGTPPAIFDAFSLVAKLSGNKEGCFVVK